MIDRLAFYLAAGRSLHPIADWATDQVLVYGPGVFLCAAIYTVWSIAARICDRLRDASRHIDHLLAPTPADDSQPGIDDDLLNHCQTAWNTPPTRKETP